MSGLRRRLRKLEEELAADTVEVVCPECGEEFRIHADTGLAYIVWEWTQGTGEKATGRLLRTSCESSPTTTTRVCSC